MGIFKRPSDSGSGDLQQSTDVPMTLEIDGIKNQTPQEIMAQNGVVGFVQERYQRSLTARRPIEQRWIQSFRNFRGLYGPDTVFLETERSRVFVKITKTKVLAAFSQVMDVLFSSNKFPIGVEPRRLPDGVAAPIVIDTNKPAEKQEQPEQEETSESPYGFPGDGREIPVGATEHILAELFSQSMADKTKDFTVTQNTYQDATLPGQIEIEPAMIAAKRMEKKIHDQLDGSNASKHLRLTAFEMVLFGTGYMKGPLTMDKELPNWEDGGVYKPTIKHVPLLEAPSIWNIYPDPDARNADGWQYVIERHKMSKSQLRALKKRPMFSADAIENCIRSGFNYTRLWWEPVIQDLPMIPSVERYEVLEFWGAIDREAAERQGLTIPKEYDGIDEIMVNAWICGNTVLRLVLNPFVPKRIPYYAVPYELQPYITWGVGLAENMQDSQDLMNGFMRMAVDNGVMSGSLVFEMDETVLVSGQDKTFYPGKIFYKNGGTPGQSIFSHQFPNVTDANMKMFDKAREIADESTGIPSITHGNSQISPGLGRTASGISMLMGAATGSIRTVVKNLDDYLLQPLGEALFAWNMQFDYDPAIKGDLEVISRGTESLMRNEVRSQRLTTFLQAVSNPQLAPFAKFPYIVREIAKSLDLDPDKCTNTNEEALLQAAIIAKMQQQAPPPPQEGAGTGPTGNQTPPKAGPQPPAGPSGNGGGTIGTGAAPGPNAAGFSGGPGGPQKPVGK